jgi:uncharacterized OsmC-like protein
VRGIPSAENLTAEVEGDIEDVNGVLKITAIRLRYRIRIPAGTREKAERALRTHADKCPAYTSVRDCISCTWKADIEEGETS